MRGGLIKQGASAPFLISVYLHRHTHENGNL